MTAAGPRSSGSGVDPTAQPAGAGVDPRSGLPAEIAKLRERLREAEETIEAIRSGSVDSLIIGPPDDTQIYMLSTADLPYRLIVAGMGEGAATVSASGAILYANTRLAEMVGRPVGELVGTPALDLVDADDWAALRALLDIAAGRSVRGQLNLSRIDGSTVPVLVSASGLAHDSAGSVCCLIATDLTAARATAELACSHAALREREAFLEQATQLVGLGTWEAEPTPDGALTWSANVYRIAGYTAGTFDQRVRTYLIDLVHPNDRAAVAEAFAEAVAGRTPFRIKHRIVRPDGTLRWVAQAAVVDREDGAPTRLLGVVQDVTEQVAAEDTARHQAVELERRVTARTADLAATTGELEQFVYAVSHDLRAPLRAITGFSRTLLDEYADELGEKGRHYAERVQANGEQMNRLLEAMLHLSRVSRTPMRIHRVDLSQIARDILADLRERDPDRQVCLDVQDGVVALADVDLIGSVLQNLLGNAWKFTGKRDPASIEFGTMPVDDTDVGYFVRDNGAGFDPRRAERLFQPFQRLHKEQEFAGTGMGLASVRRIILRHGGRVWADGDPAQGATFYFTLNATGEASTGSG